MELRMFSKQQMGQPTSKCNTSQEITFVFSSIVI